MSKLRLLLCVWVGHNEIVLSSFTHKVATKTIVTTKTICTRCGKEKTYEVTPKD